MKPWKCHILTTHTVCKHCWLICHETDMGPELSTAAADQNFAWICKQHKDLIGSVLIFRTKIIWSGPKFGLVWCGYLNVAIVFLSYYACLCCQTNQQSMKWAPSNEFVSSSFPSWQILTVHAQPFRGAMDLALCLKVLLDSLLVWASSEGSGETARMRRLAWTFAARIGDKYQICLTRSKWCYHVFYQSYNVLELISWNSSCSFKLLNCQLKFVSIYIVSF